MFVFLLPFLFGRAFFLSGNLLFTALPPRCRSPKNLSVFFSPSSIFLFFFLSFHRSRWYVSAYLDSVAFSKFSTLFPVPRGSKYNFAVIFPPPLHFFLSFTWVFAPSVSVLAHSPSSIWRRQRLVRACVSDDAWRVGRALSRLALLSTIFRCHSRAALNIVGM